MVVVYKKHLTDCGKDYFWLNQNEIPTNISMSVKLKLIEPYSTSCKHSIFDSPKCLNYRIFKEDFTLEKYFNILPDDLSKAFCHFRILNHRMPIEWGRFLGTSRDDRICELCFNNKFGDEYHYLIECSLVTLEGFICQGTCLLDQILILLGALCVQVILRNYSR